MKPGDKVVVKSGLMSGGTGTVLRTFEEMKEDKSKVVKVLAQLNNGVTLSFDSDELQVVTGAPPG